MSVYLLTFSPIPNANPIYFFHSKGKCREKQTNFILYFLFAIRAHFFGTIKVLHIGYMYLPVSCDNKMWDTIWTHLLWCNNSRGQSKQAYLVSIRFFIVHYYYYASMQWCSWADKRKKRKEKESCGRQPFWNCCRLGYVVVVLLHQHQTTTSSTIIIWPGQHGGVVVTRLVSSGHTHTYTHCHYFFLDKNKRECYNQSFYVAVGDPHENKNNVSWKFRETLSLSLSHIVCKNRINMGFSTEYPFHRRKIWVTLSPILTHAYKVTLRYYYILATSIHTYNMQTYKSMFFLISLQARYIFCAGVPWFVAFFIYSRHK